MSTGPGGFECIAVGCWQEHRDVPGDAHCAIYQDSIRPTILRLRIQDEVGDLLIEGTKAKRYVHIIAEFHARQSNFAVVIGRCFDLNGDWKTIQTWRSGNRNGIGEIEGGIWPTKACGPDGSSTEYR